jgi:hypothetical protein
MSTKQGKYVEYGGGVAEHTYGTFQENTDAIENASTVLPGTSVTEALDAAITHDEVLAKDGTRAVQTAGMQTSNGANIANDLYDISCTAGCLMVGNVPAYFDALTDEVLVGAGEGGIPCFEVNGTAGGVCSADGQAKELALVAVLVAGVVTRYGVFGIEVTNPATPTAPTEAQITTALEAAQDLGLIPVTADLSQGLVWGRIKYVWSTTTTATHRDVTTYAALAIERAMGTLG